MAIYHHFHNKAELLDGVLELLLEELEVPPEGSGTALERLRLLFEATRTVAIRHPHAFLLLPTRRFNTARAFEYYERLLGLFRDAGFDIRESARFWRLLAGYVTGAGLAEIGSRAQQPDATPVRLEKFSRSRALPARDGDRARAARRQPRYDLRVRDGRDLRRDGRTAPAAAEDATRVEGPPKKQAARRRPVTVLR